MSPERGKSNPAEPKGKRVIVERSSLKMAEAIMHNYENPFMALLELVDNAIDNRVPAETLAIRITLSNTEIKVFNRGGAGLDFEGLDRYFNWGDSEGGETRIRQYGVGGKAAAGFLGSRIAIRCSPRGEDIEYRITDEHWREKGYVADKKHEVIEESTSENTGYFEVKIEGDLRKMSSVAVATKLGEVYAPLLRKNGGKNPEVSIAVNNKPVQPLEIRYIKSDPNLEMTVGKLETLMDDKFDIVIGVMEAGQNITPGIRCYYRGKLLGIPTFFDNPALAELPQKNRLAGEVHLDTLKVTTNKAAFDQDDLYKEFVLAINKELTRWAKKLENLRVKTSEVEKYEQDLARKAKKLLEGVLANDETIERSMLPGPSTDKVRQGGGGRGPGVAGTQSNSPRIYQPGKEGLTVKKKTGGVFAEWRPQSMGNQDIRFSVARINDRDVLLINTDFPMYQAVKGTSNHKALLLHQTETAVLAVCEKLYKDLPADQFNRKVDSILKQVGLAAEPSQGAPKETFSEGSINFQQG